ncbi:MAG: hypothetical protein WC415_04400 [Patescibacteria group bacterium]|jgi:uncharacterized membrane protein YkgB
MNKFFDPIFWFNQRPGLLIPFWKNGLIAVIIASFVLAVIVFIVKKRAGLYRRLLDRIFTFFTTNFFIGLPLFFFNHESIPVLSSRLWYILWFIGMAIWIFFIVRYSLTLPDRKKEVDKEKEFQKYIPK